MDNNSEIPSGNKCKSHEYKERVKLEYNKMRRFNVH